MQVHVRTDNHIKNNEALAELIRAEVEGAFTPRFSHQIQRVDVYLQDLNSHKGGVDIRCAIEARLAGLQPLAADSRAVNVEEAVTGAVDKILHVVEHTVGRLADRGGHISMSGEPT